MSDDTQRSGDADIGYAAALTELEAILDELEAESVDVDALSVKVERAAELIRVCRERISAAAMKVEEVVADLDVPPAEREG
jgi:exodeoxyribonuclease VII small subunit